jgi:putative intracellular protease/amidase
MTTTKTIDAQVWKPLKGSYQAGTGVMPNLTRTRPKRVALIAASPMMSPTLGWPLGFWGAELTHPFYELMEAGFQADIFSSEGGKIDMDSYSDPRHESGYSWEDLMTLGFVNTPRLTALLESTKKLETIKVADYDALMVVGGQAPMFQFREHKGLQKVIANFYEAEKPTAALCHGTAALIDVKLSDGSYLIEGKTMTGFSTNEDDYADKVQGVTNFPWRIELAAKERGANYIQGGLFKSFAVRDGRLITGQQQYSSVATVKLLIEALGQ